MLTRHWSALLLSIALLGAAATTAEAKIKHRFGVGAHYWVTADDIELDNVDWDNINNLEDHINTDTITVGAAVRIQI